MTKRPVESNAIERRPIDHDTRVFQSKTPRQQDGGAGFWFPLRNRPAVMVRRGPISIQRDSFGSRSERGKRPIRAPSGYLSR
jgi:hypothetical protein